MGKIKAVSHFMNAKQESIAEVQQLELWNKGILDLSTEEVLNISKYNRHQFNKITNGHCGSHQWNQPSYYSYYIHQADQQLMRFIKVVY